MNAPKPDTDRQELDPRATRPLYVSGCAIGASDGERKLRNHLDQVGVTGEDQQLCVDVAFRVDTAAARRDFGFGYSTDCTLNHALHTFMRSDVWSTLGDRLADVLFARYTHDSAACPWCRDDRRLAGEERDSAHE